MNKWICEFIYLFTLPYRRTNMNGQALCFNRSSDCKFRRSFFFVAFFVIHVLWHHNKLQDNIYISLLIANYCLIHLLQGIFVLCFKYAFVVWCSLWSGIMRISEKRRTPIRKPKNNKIANAAGSVWLSLFMDGSGKCKLPSTYPASAEFNI